MSNESREPSAMDVVKFYRGKLEGDNPPKRFTIATADFEILAGAVDLLVRYQAFEAGLRNRPLPPGLPQD